MSLALSFLAVKEKRDTMSIITSVERTTVVLQGERGASWRFNLKEAAIMDPPHVELCLSVCSPVPTWWEIRDSWTVTN